MQDVRTKLSPPWLTLYNEFKVLFGGDPEVKLEFEDNELLIWNNKNANNKIKIYVDNTDKAVALGLLLPEFVDYGNVQIGIDVIPANETNENDLISNKIREFLTYEPVRLYDLALNGNPAYAYSKKVDGAGGFSATYVVFKNKVVQFFNDNLGDIHGIISTLYQEIAKDVFNKDIYGVFYNTDIEEKITDMPTQWL